MSPLPHTLLEPDSLAPRGIVCGDPARASEIAERLEAAELVAEAREYRTLRGHYRGTPISVCSHGIGAPGAAIAFEELAAAGLRDVIRIGTCGGLQPEVGAGQLVVATAALQATGFGREYAPIGFPAVADRNVTLALERAAADIAPATRVGMVATKDVFYPGAGDSSQETARWVDAGLLAVEMECAALFVVGSLRGLRTGAILAVDGNVGQAAESMDAFRPHAAAVTEAKQRAIEIALEALHGLE